VAGRALALLRDDANATSRRIVVDLLQKHWTKILIKEFSVDGLISHYIIIQKHRYISQLKQLQCNVFFPKNLTPWRDSNPVLLFLR
jgi:hypothetical protein